MLSFNYQFQINQLIKPNTAVSRLRKMENPIEQQQLQVNPQNQNRFQQTKVQISLSHDNDYAILYQTPQNCKLIQLRNGDTYQTQNGAFRHSHMVNQPWGSRISSFNKQQGSLNLLQPKSTLITQNLARKTQILYAMDNSAIIFKLDLKPGSVVIQAGTGSGSLSCAISQTIKDQGHLYTFEFNKQRAQITKKFFQDLNKTNITSNWRDVVQDGFGIQNKYIRADALFLDVPNPWAAIHHTKKSIKKYGRICCFSPCIQQVQRTTTQMRKQNFIKIQTFQCLSRQIYQQQINLQGPQGFKRNAPTSLAVHNNRGHTGYLTFGISL